MFLMPSPPESMFVFLLTFVLMMGFPLYKFLDTIKRVAKRRACDPCILPFQRRGNYAYNKHQNQLRQVPTLPLTAA